MLLVWYISISIHCIAVRDIVFCCSFKRSFKEREREMTYTTHLELDQSFLNPVFSIFVSYSRSHCLRICEKNRCIRFENVVRNKKKRKKYIHHHVRRFFQIDTLTRIWSFQTFGRLFDLRRCSSFLHIIWRVLKRHWTFWTFFNLNLKFCEIFQTIPIVFFTYTFFDFSIQFSLSSPSIHRSIILVLMLWTVSQFKRNFKYHICKEEWQRL